MVVGIAQGAQSEERIHPRWLDAAPAPILLLGVENPTFRRLDGLASQARERPNMAQSPVQQPEGAFPAQWPSWPCQPKVGGTHAGAELRNSRPRRQWTDGPQRHDNQQ